MKAYRYRSVGWWPGARLAKPLSEAKVLWSRPQGCIFHTSLPSIPRSKVGAPRSGQLPGGVDVQALRIAHRSSAFDQTGALQDRNLVFPLDHLRELVERREVGSLNHRHVSFMGSITALGHLISETAPQVAAELREDQVDAVFLVPV
jgi:hypothetical protein